MIVVDASVAVKILSREHGADRALVRVAAEDVRSAPNWIRLEVANAMARKVREGTLSADAATKAAAGVTTLVEVQLDSFDLLNDAFALSIEIGHPMYDCLYLAAGIRDGAMVITADKQFAERAAKGGFAERVELIA